MDWLFPEPIHEITIEGLKDRLRDVPEGLYVEYKGAETIGQTDDIAKAIAAFANTHGGWLFLGIEEDTNNDNRPKEDGFCGIRMADAETQRMYHIATDHLDPGPQIAVAAVALSDAEASNRIIAIHVAESDDPPLIRRKDGRVYVRTGNTSRPVDYIKNRVELEGLYDKATRNANIVSERLARHKRGDTLIKSGTGTPHQITQASQFSWPTPSRRVSVPPRPSSPLQVVSSAKCCLTTRNCDGSCSNHEASSTSTQTRPYS